MAEQLFGLTSAQMRKLGLAVEKTNRQSSKTKDSGISTYKPGITTQLIGYLTSTVKYDTTIATHETWKGTFQAWGADDPNDDTLAEVEQTDYPELDVWLWSTVDGTELVAGVRVIVSFIAGRWYVTGCESCPTPSGGG